LQHPQKEKYLSKKNNIEKSLIKDFLVSSIFSIDFPAAL